MEANSGATLSAMATPPKAPDTIPMSYDDLKEEDFTTLSGLAMFLIGRVPKAGDLFSYKNLQFEVVDMDRGRVDKLLVIKKEEEE